MKRIALFFLLFTFCLASSASAQQQALSHPSSTYYVKVPNGTDDTANIQAALDACVIRGKGCIVQLAAGKYLTRQLVAYNFRGTFKGMGESKTVLEALPELEVTGFPQRPNNEFFECKPNITDCTYPSLIVFVDGDIRISDMAIKITAVPATKSWFIFVSELTYLLDAVRIMGQYRTNAHLNRVSISGMPDPNSGYNLGNGVIFAGEFPRSETDLDYYFLSGTFSVTNSSFNAMSDGVLADGFFTDSRLTVGGSSSSGNVFEDLYIGINLESLGNSLVELSYNTLATGIFESVGVMPWCCWIPTKPSLFLIHDNIFKPTGAYADGVYLQDDPTNKWVPMELEFGMAAMPRRWETMYRINALFYGNSIEAQDIGYGGISAYSTRGTVIVNNKLSGNGFTVVPDLAQIDGGTTTHSTVVCENHNDTVLDQGTMNKIIGCQQLAAVAGNSTLSAAPAASVARPDRPRRKQSFR